MAKKKIPLEIHNAIWPNLVCPGCDKLIFWWDTSTYSNRYTSEPKRVHHCRSIIFGPWSYCLSKQFLDNLPDPKISEVIVCSKKGCDSCKLPNSDYWYRNGKSAILKYVPIMSSVRVEERICDRHIFQ
jgi:hypothetical protein